jgi:hypothetical protein
MAATRTRGLRWRVLLRRSNGYKLNRSFLRSVDAERWAREAEADRRFLQADPSRLMKLRLSELTPKILAVDRDARLALVRPASVLRERALLQHVLEVARKEWDIGLPVNPCTMVATPSPDPSRQRRIAGEEMTRLDAHRRC